MTENLRAYFDDIELEECVVELGLSTKMNEMGAAVVVVHSYDVATDMDYYKDMINNIDHIILIISDDGSGTPEGAKPEFSGYIVGIERAGSNIVLQCESFLLMAMFQTASVEGVTNSDTISILNEDEGDTYIKFTDIVATAADEGCGCHFSGLSEPKSTVGTLDKYVTGIEAHAYWYRYTDTPIEMVDVRPDDVEGVLADAQSKNDAYVWFHKYLNLMSFWEDVPTNYFCYRDFEVDVSEPNEDPDNVAVRLLAVNFKGKNYSSASRPGVVYAYNMSSDMWDPMIKIASSINAEYSFALVNAQENYIDKTEKKIYLRVVGDCYQKNLLIFWQACDMGAYIDYLSVDYEYYTAGNLIDAPELEIDEEDAGGIWFYDELLETDYNIRVGDGVSICKTNKSVIEDLFAQVPGLISSIDIEDDGRFCNRNIDYVKVLPAILDVGKSGGLHLFWKYECNDVDEVWTRKISLKSMDNLDHAGDPIVLTNEHIDWNVQPTLKYGMDRYNSVSVAGGRARFGDVGKDIRIPSKSNPDCSARAEYIHRDGDILSTSEGQIVQQILLDWYSSDSLYLELRLKVCATAKNLSIGDMVTISLPGFFEGTTFVHWKHVRQVPGMPMEITIKFGRAEIDVGY